MIRLLSALVLLFTATCTAAAFDPFAGAGIDPKPGAQLPVDLPFTNESGAPATLRQLGRGKPIVLAPVLHNCPNICGVTLGGLMSAVEAQSYRPGRAFAVVAFGIDPAEGPQDARKTVESLDQRNGGTTGIHALTGTEADVRAVTDALGYRYAFDSGIGQYAHVAAVAVLTPDGRLARWLYGVAPDPTDLRLALTEAGRGTIGSFGDQLLLLCYHYDPTTGRYSSVIWLLLQVGGGATVLALSGFVGLAVLRERRRGSSRR
ncbi:electron transporter SenC [Inquilinus limosus MP06]|uniref:Electron transporter SenC n=1 Tax=Inquilinus limosus MP06 TaxID=1398085 RepID=A0A0A0DBR3_9PROT|nr:SCO family protein [Inquilinus limosus]KGM34407.1 electron transporter SenC [Inquilinus limosus MP06]